MPKALVVLNPAARFGSGKRRYGRVFSAVESRFDAWLVETDTGGAWTSAVEVALKAGVRTFVAAGGDGTVSAVAGALVERRGSIPLGDIRLGAVGLGRSNDFHKPNRALIGGVPAMINTGAATPRDIGFVRYQDDEGKDNSRVFLVGVSLGAMAAVNARFSLKLPPRNR